MNNSELQIQQSIIIGGSQAERMTSLDIAEVIGKPHNDVLKAIRKMEAAWEKVQGGNFSLLQKIYNLPNGGKKLQPYYSLTKTETLYIATKFNDEARAKLVLRWELLETKRLAATQGVRRLLASDQDVMQEAERIVRDELADHNHNADGCLTTTDIAKSLYMETSDLNSFLCDQGVQKWKSGRFRLTERYENRGLAETRLFIYYSKDGKQKQRTYLVWTQQGCEMIKKMLN